MVFIDSEVHDFLSIIFDCDYCRHLEHSLAPTFLALGILVELKPTEYFAGSLACGASLVLLHLHLPFKACHNVHSFSVHSALVPIQVGQVATHGKVSFSSWLRHE